jgi:uncharacterized pyridoxamine 5'-phosphate oxidase family protein
MNKSEVLELINRNPVFFLATVEDNQPRVRGMLIYKADESGIIFHTATMRDVYKQIMKNPNVELCFNDQKSFTQVRVSGVLEEIKDEKLKDEIADHPSRAFLKPWRDSISHQDFCKAFVVFKLKSGLATIWSMDRNLEPKIEVKL